MLMKKAICTRFIKKQTWNDISRLENSKPMKFQAMTLIDGKQHYGTNCQIIHSVSSECSVSVLFLDFYKCFAHWKVVFICKYWKKNFVSYGLTVCLWF